MLRVFLLEVRCILTEIVPLQILATFGRLIGLFTLSQSLLKSNLLGLQSLDLLLFLLLLLLDALSLSAVDGQLIVGLLGHDFGLECLAFALESVLV